MQEEDVLKKYAKELYRISRMVQRNDPDIEKRYVEAMSKILVDLYGADETLLVETPVDLEGVRESMKDIASPMHAYYKFKKVDRVREQYSRKATTITYNIVDAYLTQEADEIMRKLKAKANNMIYTDTYRDLLDKYTNYYKDIVKDSLEQLFCEGVLMYGLDPGRVENYIRKHIEGISEGIAYDLDNRKHEFIGELEESIRKALSEIIRVENGLEKDIIEALTDYIASAGVPRNSVRDRLTKIIGEKDIHLIPLRYTSVSDEYIDQSLSIYGDTGFDTSVPFKVYDLDIDVPRAIGVEGMRVIMFNSVEDRERFVEKFVKQTGYEPKKINDMDKLEVDPMTGWTMYLPRNKPYIIEIW